MGNVPSFGARLAWSESGGATPTRCWGAHQPGGPGGAGAAICGRTAAYGHLDAGRRRIAWVRCPVRTPDDYGALGYWVGRWVGGGVPYIEGLDLPPVGASTPLAVSGEEAAAGDTLKLLGAALASSGAVALYHIHGVTPEARALPDLCPPDVAVMDVEDLGPARQALNSDASAIDLVVVGCPHASLTEVRHIAAGIRGKRLRAACGSPRRARAQAAGRRLVAMIGRRGPGDRRQLRRDCAHG